MKQRGSCCAGGGIASGAAACNGVVIVDFNGGQIVDDMFTVVVAISSLLGQHAFDDRLECCYGWWKCG